MSYLSRPRAHFFGNFAVSPPTANNNNYFMVLDPENVTFFDPYLTMNDDVFRQAMQSVVTINFEGFLGLGKEQVLQGNWNHYGDNRIRLTNASIYAIDAPDGRRITSSAEDPLIGAPIQMLGDRLGDTDTPPIMVDSDPTSDLASQIFCSQFLIGKPACMCSASRRSGAPLPRAYSRWIYIFFRNLVEMPDATFSAIWQHGLPNANLAFDNRLESPTLKELQYLAAQANGLEVRYCTYFFRRKYTDLQMAEFYQAGTGVRNESDGFVLGTVGIWGSGELGSYPGGRLLLPVQSEDMVFMFNGKPRPYTLAPAFAQVDPEKNVIVLDLITAFPEVTTNPGADPTKLQKIDLGPVTLQVVDSKGSVTAIGQFPYDSHTYVSGGGLVEVPFAANQLEHVQSGSLQVSCAAFSHAVLAEQTAVVESDDHCVYITEGQSVPIPFRVWQRGGAPTVPIKVAFEQFRSTEQLGPVNPNNPKSFRIPYKLDTSVPNSQNSPPPFLQISPLTQMVGESGTGTLTLTGLAPGLGLVRMLAGSDNPPDPDPQGMPKWMWVTYINVRVLPADDQFDSVPDSELTFDYVYDNVLRYYYRLYPAMDSYVALNDPEAVAQAAPMLRKMIDRSNWCSTLYMPVTRELSDGKRRLLQRWCDIQAAAHAARNKKAAGGP